MACRGVDLLSRHSHTSGFSLFSDNRQRWSFSPLQPRLHGEPSDCQNLWNSAHFRLWQSFNFNLTSTLFFSLISPAQSHTWVIQPTQTKIFCTRPNPTHESFYLPNPTIVDTRQFKNYLIISTCRTKATYITYLCFVSKLNTMSKMAIKIWLF